MVYLFVIIQFCISFNLDFIPKTKSPPCPRLSAFMCYLKPRNSVILFGGWNMITIFDDLWEFSLDSLTWQKVIYSANYYAGISHPGARRYLSGYSSLSEPKFYIFGGITLMGPENDLWSFDFESLRWEKQTTYHAPSARSYPGYTSYEEDGKQYLILQGGSILDKFVNEIYR